MSYFLLFVCFSFLLFFLLACGAGLGGRSPFTIVFFRGFSRGSGESLFVIAVFCVLGVLYCVCVWGVEGSLFCRFGPGVEVLSDS